MSKRKTNPTPGSPRKALGGSPLKLGNSPENLSGTRRLIADLYADEAKYRAEAECRDGNAIEGACEPAKPWHDGIRFRSPSDRARAEVAVQQMTARMCSGRDQAEKEMCARYDTRIARLEADLREACQRDANHMIERAKNGNQTAEAVMGMTSRGGGILG